jgi:hypothetical protein
MTVPQVIQALQEGKFQPVTPYIIVHFLIRHDLINKDNDEQYDELVECLKKKIPVPLPHRLEETIQDEEV